MLLGKRVLGDKGAAIERLKQEGVNKGVGLGKRVIAHDPKLSGVVSAAGRPARASGNRTTRARQAQAAPKPVDVGFSEGEIDAMLAEDANLWPSVLDAESKRPDGPRAAVAAMLIAAAPKADAQPMPASILAELETIATIEE